MKKPHYFVKKKQGTFNELTEKYRISPEINEKKTQLKKS
jgi:hypothetical protein